MPTLCSNVCNFRFFPFNFAVCYFYGTNKKFIYWFYKQILRHCKYYSRKGKHLRRESQTEKEKVLKLHVEFLLHVRISWLMKQNKKFPHKLKAKRWLYIISQRNVVFEEETFYLYFYDICLSHLKTLSGTLGNDRYNPCSKLQAIIVLSCAFMFIRRKSVFCSLENCWTGTGGN